MASTGSDTIRQNLKHNYVVNVLDGTFFGFGIGFASFSTIIPLFVSQLTDSAVLIGLIPAIHTMGWQLPQLFLASWIARQPRFKPFTVLATIQERVPFLGLAMVALLVPTIGIRAALWLTFFFLIWQGLGGGFTANPWQNMIGRVIPSDYLATFFGFQSAGANLTAAAGAIFAGYILDRVAGPFNFAINFAIAGGLMAISFIFISLTREPAREITIQPESRRDFWKSVMGILKSNANFRLYLITRNLSQFGMMASAFYTVYAVKYMGMTEISAGIMTSILFITQVASNPLLGRLSDKWSRKWVLVIGAVSGTLSALLAVFAPSLDWFAAIFILAGVASTAFWSISIALTLEFGPEEERPTYVGMANTLISPSAILAPLLGGWLADTAGYPVTFLAAAGFSIITVILLVSLKDPRKARQLETTDNMG